MKVVIELLYAFYSTEHRYADSRHLPNFRDKRTTTKKQLQQQQQQQLSTCLDDVSAWMIANRLQQDHNTRSPAEC